MLQTTIKPERGDEILVTVVGHPSQVRTQSGIVVSWMTPDQADVMSAMYADAARRARAFDDANVGGGI